MTGRAAEIRSNLDRVRARIATAAERAGRRAEDVTLVAVTKLVSVPDARAAAAAGALDLGESRVQEAEKKMGALEGAVRWHLVGRVQTNKASGATRFDLVHSLDRPRLAEALNRAGEAAGRPCRALVQLNVTGSASQGGIAPDETKIFIEKCLRLPYLRICGLMAIGPYPADAGEVRRAFRSVVEVYRRLAPGLGPEFSVLSLGMSGDFEAAIEEGSTLVRVGTAIFGQRR